MIYCYARVSTDTQGRDGVSLEQQIETMTKWATAIGDEYVIKKEIKSARTVDNRAVFKEILSIIKAGDTLMCYDQTRLGRDAKNDLNTAEFLLKNNIKLYIDNRYINLGNPVEYFNFVVLCGFSTFQSQLQAKKSTEAIKKVRESGDWIFDGRLFGYEVIRTRGETKISIEPTSARYIKYMFDEVAKGRTVGSLVAELEGTIIPAFPKWLFFDTSVRQMFRNPIYMGKYFSKPNLKHKVKDMERTEIESVLVKSNYYPPIVDEETWWKCYENWHSVRRANVIRDSAKRELSGVIKCPVCGASAYADWAKTKKDGTKVKKFGTTRHYPTCSKKVHKSFFEEQWTWVIRVSFFLTFLNGAEVGSFYEEKKAIALANNEERNRQKDELNVALTGIMKQLDNYRKNLGDGTPWEFVKDNVVALQEKEKQIRKQIEDIEKIQLKEEDFIAEILEFSAEETMTELIEGTSFERRKLYMKYTDGGAKYYDNGMKITYLNGKSFYINYGRKYARKPPLQRFEMRYKDEEPIYGLLDFDTKKIIFDEIEIADEDGIIDIFKKSYNDGMKKLASKAIENIARMEEIDELRGQNTI